MAYFCTFTCYDWLPLFELTDFYGWIYKWFDLLKSKDNHILGYVIMPNHLHLLLTIPGNSDTIDKVIGEGKRFMAYEIVKRLKHKKMDGILQTLSGGVTEFQMKRGYKHKVFEDSFDGKLCYTAEFIQQKLNYIHSNPLSERWQLAKLPEEYVHSSAKYYSDGGGIYPVTHYAEFYSIPIAK